MYCLLTPCPPLVLTPTRPHLFLRPLVGLHHDINDLKVMPAEHLHQNMHVFVSVLAMTVMPKTSSGNALHFLTVSKERDVIDPFNTQDI